MGFDPEILFAGDVLLSSNQRQKRLLGTSTRQKQRTKLLVGGFLWSRPAASGGHGLHGPLQTEIDAVIGESGRQRPP